jgi:hypothetical protein
MQKSKRQLKIKNFIVSLSNLRFSVLPCRFAFLNFIFAFCGSRRRGFGLLQVIILAAILISTGINVFLWKEFKAESRLAVLSSARNISTDECESS